MIYTKSFSSDIAPVSKMAKDKSLEGVKTKVLYQEKNLPGAFGKYRFTGTAEVVDRDGEIVKAEGLEIDDFVKNPVVLWSHDLRAEPIGRVVGVERDLSNKRVYFDIIFAPTEDGKRIESLVNTGFLKAVSIGFVVDDYEFDDDTLTFTKTRMHEISLCSVPANQEALLHEDKSVEEPKQKNFTPEDITAIAQQVAEMLAPKPDQAEDTADEEPEAQVESTEVEEPKEETDVSENITITGNLDAGNLATTNPSITIGAVGTDSTQALVEILQAISDKLNFIQPTEANSDKTEQDTTIRSEEQSPSEQTEEPQDTLSVETEVDLDPVFEIDFTQV